MSSALLGYTGFVGSNLLNQLKQKSNDELYLYNSKNLNTIQNKEFDDIYCCCVPGVKYIANREPYKDLSNICNILDILKTVKSKRFFLVSSQDCNANLWCSSDIDSAPITEYGKNRKYFEENIKNIFENSYILRIGCLFGNNLKKNIIYDLLNNHYLSNLKYDYTMQLYCLDDLLDHLLFMKDNNIHLMNRFSPPIYISEIINVFNECGFNYKFNLELNPKIDYRNSCFLENTDYSMSKEYELSKLKEFIRKNRMY